MARTVDRATLTTPTLAPRQRGMPSPVTDDHKPIFPQFIGAALGDVAVEVADGREVGPKVVRVGFDGEPGAIGLLAKQAAKLAEVGPALARGTLGVPFRSNLRAVFVARR